MAKRTDQRGAPRSFTPRLDLPYPEPENAADVPLWIRDLCNRLEAILLSNGLDGEALVPGTPVGSIVAWTNPSPPAGWALCAGQVYDRVQYQSLWNVLGTRFESHATEAVTASNFAVPNLQGRVIEATGDQSIGHVYDGARSQEVPAHEHHMDHFHGMQYHTHSIAHEHSYAATSGIANWPHGTHWVGSPHNNYIIVGNEGDPGAGTHSHVHGVGGVTTGGPGQSGTPSTELTSGAVNGAGTSQTDTSTVAAVPINTMQPTVVLPYIIRIK